MMEQYGSRIMRFKPIAPLSLPKQVQPKRRNMGGIYGKMNTNEIIIQIDRDPH